MTITDRLFALQDTSYADFQSRLTPGIPRKAFIGVRVPQCRYLAKELIRSAQKNPAVSEQVTVFLNTLPHKYYDENILHGLLISELKDFSEALSATEHFLPYIDNWAVCDITVPKALSKNKPALLKKIRSWSESAHTYTIRFGLEALMRWFLDADFRPEYLEIPAAVISEEYYVNMMIAWFFATALAKQWDAAIPYITENRLPLWVHNKTIQKARESFRITAAQKEYLKKFRR